MPGLHSLLHRRAARAEPAAFRDAIVLSGGGSLGAAQVGALRALLEAGVRPDLLVGCSVGALNAEAGHAAGRAAVEAEAASALPRPRRAG